jgi:hypothetical protein
MYTLYYLTRYTRTGKIIKKLCLSNLTPTEVKRQYGSAMYLIAYSKSYTRMLDKFEMLNRIHIKRVREAQLLHQTNRRTSAKR